MTSVTTASAIESMTSTAIDMPSVRNSALAAAYASSLRRVSSAASWARMAFSRFTAPV